MDPLERTFGKEAATELGQGSPLSLKIRDFLIPFDGAFRYMNRALDYVSSYNYNKETDMNTLTRNSFILLGYSCSTIIGGGWVLVRGLESCLR